MAKRGRPSPGDIEARELLACSEAQRPDRFPLPPAELPEGQAAVWRDAIIELPWLRRGQHPLLVAHCRHVTRSRLLEQQIAAFKLEWAKRDDGLARLDRLLSMADRESKAMLATARALRLTPQAMMHPRTAGRAINNQPLSIGPKPWD